MKKRLVSFCMALCLALFVLPLTASAEGETVKVTFLVPAENGFRRHAVVDIPVGECLAEYLPDDPVSENGDVFTGWTFEGKLIDPEMPVTENIRLVAKWAQIYTVSFDANEGFWEDGSDVLELEMLGGEEDPLPEPPERDGYAFLNWNTEPDGSGADWEELGTLQNDTTVYAQWGRIFYVIFHGNGDVSDIEDSYTAEYPDITAHDFPLPAMRWEGRELVGWNTQADGLGEHYAVGDSYRVEAENSPAELYAMWRRQICRVTFEGFPETECLWGESVADVPVPETDEGGLREVDGVVCRFGGWYTGKDGTGVAFTKTDSVRGDVYLYAYWVPQAEVTFQIAHGTWIESGTKSLTLLLDEGEALADHLPTPVPDEGFSEAGSWDTDPAVCSAAPGAAYTFTCDAVKFYTVTFESVGQVLVAAGETVTELPIPEKPGWDFVGWFTESGVPLTADTPVTGDLALFPRWEKTIILSFDPNGGEGGPEALSVTTAEETAAIAIPDRIPTRSGYTFLGWGMDGVEVQPGDTLTVSGNLTLSAVWQKDPTLFRLHYHANGGTDAPETDLWEGVSGEHSFTVTEAVPTRTGYSFLGWSPDKDAQIPAYHAGDPLPVTGERTLYAVWQKDPETFTVLFIDRGSEWARLELVEGSPIGDLPQPPVRPGYRFLGWNTKDSGETIDSDTVVQKDLTVYAQWVQIQQITVSFLDRKAALPQITLEAGEALGGAMPDEPVRKGFLFAGWETESGEIITRDTPISESITLYARWEPITRGNVIFMDRGRETDRITLDLGASIGENMPDEPQRAGFRFLGWNTRDDGTGKKLYRSTVLREDLTVYARWEKIETFTVTFRDRGETVAKVTVEEGRSLGDAMPSKPTRSGYSFKGWTTERDGSGRKFYKTTSVKEDMTVYAQWARKDRTNPPTGDDSHTLFWAAVLFLSGTALVCIGKSPDPARG